MLHRLLLPYLPYRSRFVIAAQEPQGAVVRGLQCSPHHHECVPEQGAAEEVQRAICSHPQG